MIWAGYPGQMGGQAIAEAIFGVVPPSGRLPYSILTDESVKSMNPMRLDMRPNASDGYSGRTYRFYTPVHGAAAPVYTFGFGLSFTTWRYDWIGASPADDACGSSAQLQRAATVQDYLQGLDSPHARLLGTQAGALVLENRVNVTNTGSVDSATSVLAFSSPPGAGTAGTPLRQLVGFEKVILKAGESASIFFGMAARDLTLVSGEGERAAATGVWALRVGVEGSDEPIERQVCV